MPMYGSTAEVQFEIVAAQQGAFQALTEAERGMVRTGWKGVVNAAIGGSQKWKELEAMAAPHGLPDLEAAFDWTDLPVERVLAPLAQHNGGKILALTPQASLGWTPCGRGCHYGPKGLHEASGNNFDTLEPVTVTTEFPLGSGTMWTATVSMLYTIGEYT